MQKYRYLIVGGGAAGVAAAESVRANDKEGSMAIVSDEPYLMYSRVMLSKPNFFLGKIPFDQIYLKNRSWYTDNNIDFLGGRKAIALDRTMKAIELADGSKIQYDKLLIATGVDARRWSVPGFDKKGIHYLRSLEDGMGIMEGIKTAKKAVTIGGGFISFEMADLLNMAKIETTMLLRESYFWEPVLDRDSGTMIENALLKGGVKLIKNAEVTEVKGQTDVEGVTIRSSVSNETSELSCQMIVCGIGVTNPIDWAQKGGLVVNRGIIANEYLQTSDSSIWTAGDIAEYNDLLLEEHVQMGNWVNAREQGRIAGLNMTGKSDQFKFVSFYTTQGFGISIAFVGDVTPGEDREVIRRGSPEINSYARILIRNGEIEGATLLNRTSEMTTISKLIEKNIRVSDKKTELGDPDFDLKSLLA